MAVFSANAHRGCPWPRVGISHGTPPAATYSESEIGLSWARRRGIQEERADLIIFVDDDNALEETYLPEAIKIGQEWRFLGMWGSGSIRGDFEVEPQESLRELRPWLALRELSAPRWSDLASCEDAIPWGTGLCVRKEVAIAYTQSFDLSPIQITGRQGASLSFARTIRKYHLSAVVMASVLGSFQSSS
jgi:hypothetical protein